jgi:hypothetical protein
MCGQRSSVATMPGRRVREQDVELAAADPAHRPGAARELEQRLEAAVARPARAREAGRWRASRRLGHLVAS